jgi:hypothetical protein
MGENPMGGKEQMRRLPASLPGVGRVGTLSDGARKALANMRQEYGSAKGNEIFLKKAEEKGHGKTLRAKINSTYRKGAKLP